ncbi:SDR family oxidoreductase [Sphaerisporangium perillae]|uniref:SDR family oxidoreductase n=1 Tax=Sphaerisporangium perillae TaxID=2935860 RepID=UPI00200C2F80|nr:SDR family NAD(P)-dependent oxidoreductase [Sphaerisporangium perillae]
MDLNLRGRSVLVTGATGGIGQAIARVYAAEGARVALTYHTGRERAEKLAGSLAEGGAAEVMTVRYALEDPSSVTSAVAALERWNGPDVLIANAVRWGARRAPGQRLWEVPPEQWEPVIGHNLAPTLRTVQLAVQGMAARRFGRIVLVSSHVALNGHPGQEFYGAAKAALHGFCRSLAWEAGAEGVLANVVCPGLTLTERARTGLPEHIRQAETARTPTGRLSSPEDVASAVAFLGSPANGNITGQLLTVAGGR